MKKHQLLLGFIFVLHFVSFSQNNKGEEIPNIVFMLADDLGYGELGSYGQEKIKTPFLDQLSKEGMRFTNFYAGNSLCSPSRAVLMTGISSGKSSIRGNIGFHPEREQFDRVSIKPKETTLAEMLKPAGYETIYFGKWHLDDPYHLETWAANRGFDYAVQGQWKRLNGNLHIDSDYDWINGLDEAIKYDYKKYSCMDEFRTTQAIDYFEKRDDDKPFFLFMSYRIPHGHEVDIRNKTMYNKTDWPEIERLHAARITLLDEQVGRLMRYLEVTGRLDNTLIVFTSDNGGQKENGHDEQFFKSNGEYRGAKRDLYEGGIKVPLFVIWKGKIKQGTTNNHVGAFQDIMPTLAEVAKINTPSTSDGISFLPTLCNNTIQNTHDYLYWELHLNKMDKNGNDKGFRQAVRQGKWKAVRYGLKSETELYDLSKDETESINLSSKFPKKLRELEKLFKNSSNYNENFKYGGNTKF
ncbi:sulfatase-like hydrolase/transferase [Tamlana agarivorans]|uniref:Sulfatase-like hydrolase/transferase n=1 Tax=Pseudotamlana agarivorans TaxID=481183 RepID=A0ACC5U9M9_9FLAO|nr:sulfatase-like hydrolase/transferase [Tamlana agarivorans]MBU2950990.1 sulfatase-like hydrolase/transferase [Tamlana agarivorans]